MLGRCTVRREITGAAFERVDSEMLEDNTRDTFSLEFFQGFGAGCILERDLLRVRVQGRVCRLVN